MLPSPTKVRDRSRMRSTQLKLVAAPFMSTQTPRRQQLGQRPIIRYQLKTMLQGVVARGTARSISALSPYVAGKTGTTEDSVDGWFIGFTNDVTIAVWVGY